jgi:hypothetical protein
LKLDLVKTKPPTYSGRISYYSRWHHAWQEICGSYSDTAQRRLILDYLPSSGPENLVTLFQDSASMLEIWTLLNIRFGYPAAIATAVIEKLHSLRLTAKEPVDRLIELY